MSKFLIYCLFIFSLSASAQQDTSSIHRFEHGISLGVNIGASSPLSFPATIRKINSWSPHFNPALGYECLYHATSRLGTGLGVRLDFKGMTVKDEVMYMHTKIILHNGSTTEITEGYFTGSNETNIQNTYLTFPVFVAYDPSPKWRFKLGAYVAVLLDSKFTGTVANGYLRKETPLGEKVLIDRTTFDLSAEQNKWDMGIHLSGQRLVSQKVAIATSFAWGLTPLFPKDKRSMDFNMYNLYLTVGGVYKINPARKTEILTE